MSGKVVNKGACLRHIVIVHGLRTKGHSNE